MKKQVLMFFIAMLAIGQNAFAYMFSSVAPSGQTLYYNIIDNHAEVVRPGTSSSYNNYVAGNLIIPDSVTYNSTTYPVIAISSIPYGYDGQCGAFMGCSSLLSVTIPATITSIGYGSFSGCYGLAATNYTGTIAQWCNIDFGYWGQNSPTIYSHSLKINGSMVTNLVIPEGVTEIKHGAFDGCSALTSITIPSTVTVIGRFAFRDCSGVNNIVIPEGVTIINAATFCGCSGLESITLPSTITFIDSAAFRYCSSLTEIVSMASLAPAMAYSYNPNEPYYNLFYNVPSTTIVRIPCGSISSYSTQWTYFSNLIEIGSYTINAISSDLAMGQVNVITAPTCQNPSALVYSIASPGYHFVGWSDANIDNPRVLSLTSDTSIVGYFFADDTPIIDTVIVHDTTYITLTDTLMVTQYDTITYTIFDTIGIYIYDTLTLTDTLWLTEYLHDTIYLPQYLHDTVFIHDTIYITLDGTGDVDELNSKVYSSQGQIVVEGANGNTVVLYDGSGRVLAIKQDNYTSLRFAAPVSGTYMIKIGAYPARKVVVIR